jgi:hypothetical protein
MDSIDNEATGAEGDRPSDSWFGGLSRRAFLRRGTLTAAAVGVMSAVPGLPGLLAGGASEAPAVDSGISEAEGDAGALAEPLLAHVKDLGTGEITLFQGEREIVVRNPSLARQILSAAHP